MSVSDADIAFALELFAPLGGLSQRKMFGGLSIYHNGDIFCIVSSDARIYLKCGKDLAADLKASGSEQFHNMPYWSLPDEDLDDPDAASAQARRALLSLKV